MRMKTKTFVFAFLLVMLIGIANVNAVQPTQQYNKIFLSPFYNPSMSINTNTTYSVNVNPPDKISSVISAIISFDVYITPTVTFTLWVNNQSCNNPNYVVSTTFAGSGQSRITFDCSNIINKAGTYSVIIRPTQANTGAISGWLDLTYMNNPSGNVLLHGTEYITGDVGKMFLQFLDADNQPVNFSECFLSVWFPNDTIFFNNSLMSKLENAVDGIYYKNLNIPNVTGVYPASAKCYRPVNFANRKIPNYAFDSFESNTWTGGTGWNICPVNSTNCQNGWDVEDTVPLATIVSTATANPCGAGSFCAKLTGIYGFIERGLSAFPDGVSVVNITYMFRFKGFQTNEHMDFFLFDGNWHLVDQIGNAVQYGGYTNNIWYNKTYTLSSSNYEMEQWLIGWYATSQTPSTSDEFWVDNINISLVGANISLSNITDYQILRGSGEIHVSNLFNQLNASFSSISPFEIWNYSNRTLTTGSGVVGGTEYSTTEKTGRIVARILDGGGNPVVSAVCNLSIFYPTNVSVYLNDLMLGGGNITGGGQGIYYYDFNQSGYVGVHTYAIECIKGGQKFFLLGTYHVFGNNLTTIAESVWNYSGSISTNILTQFVNSIWNYTGTIASNILTQISNTIWSAGNRNLTYYPNATTQVISVNNVTLNLTTQIVDVQNVTLNVTLNTSIVSVQNITNNITTQIVSVNNVSVNPNDIAENVWNFSNRYTHGEISV